ncbi:telomere-associated protein RIF1 [Maniola jurtina]|uniref:telomere-associated protein RIF1 n=1 Tax=Maniola jurtina TaxID=191418 RepID=UPI001E68DAB0|nr:telomere-associated protein RIF1 [Maniola jurtina]
MPEDCTTESELEQVLDDLEDYSLNARNYQTLLDTLNSVDHITASTAEKLLLLCFRDRIEDWKYTTHVLNIVKTLLKKIKDGLCTPLPNLVPSALAILNVLNTAAQFKLEALKTMCFEILLSYPDEAIIGLCISHSHEIFKLINLYCQRDDLIPAELRIQPIHIVARLLRILPPDTKETFVKDGINIWFTRVIPLVVGESVTNTSDTVLNLLEALELLTDELVKFEYAKNSSWLEILVNIHTPTRYPALVKSLLENRSNYWHRLWIVFIKLLKSQITKCNNTTASPINTLLPCVETAFKLDVKNRCRAFLCWNALIDNFSKEPSEALLNKRLKLLMVPLTANNAKVEETALAKLKTWWYLITSFEAKLDKFLEIVVIPFLTFCFGKPGGHLLVPGKISAKTKVMCVQAFINVIGHSQCEGCVAMPRLKVKLLNTKLLVNHYKDWIHSISSAIRICVEQSGDFTEQHIKCIWKSFIMTIGELPENNIRRDLFNEALILLDGLTQDCDNRLMGAIVNVLIPTLFDRDEEIQPLLKSNDEQNAPVHKIFAVLNKLPLDSLEDRVTALESIKLMVDYAVKTSSNTVELLLMTLTSNGVLLWTALAEAIGWRVYSACPRLLAKMFLWPFNFMNNFANKVESTSAWLNLYKTISSNKQIKSINKDIIKALMTHGVKHSSCVFVLNATIAVLENKLLQGDTDFDKEVELILQLTSEVNETQIKLILPSLSGIIVHTLTALIKNINVPVAETVMFIINNILKICKVVFQEQPENESDLLKDINNIFNSLESFFKLDLYSRLKIYLADQLKECAPYLKNDKLLHSHILAIYKTSVNKNLAYNTVEEVVQAFEINEVPNLESLTPKQNEDSKKFPTPSGKAVKKSKKEASITSTVIENGEEYVVVKSNWKFNPRKLTENQKEKLQRKREDIPAMYQDLSQSQDEFKLTTWKTDSQDTSTTSSKSANEDVSVILKNIPNFFPKITENVSSKPVTDVTQNTEPSKEKFNINNDKSENDKINNVQSTVKDVKSPRMALKDRVLRNVRNLTERSNLDQECTDVTVNILKTPIVSKVKPLSNSIISTPSQINPERPSRVKRKPKKFDDVELLSLTKKRHSLNSSDSQTDIEITENQINTKMDTVKDDKTVDYKAKDDKDKKDDDNDKAKDVDNTIENSAVVKSDINAVERHENDELGGKVTMTNCFVVTENLNLTNDAIKKCSKKDESKSNALPATMYFKKKETIEEKPCPYKTDNSKVYISSDKIETVKEKAEEKTCSDDNTVAVSTPKVTDKVIEKQACSSKKSNRKKSRIESQLAIDMVEGHPFLKVQSEKRSTRKPVLNSPLKRKRLSFDPDSNKFKRKGTRKAENKTKEKSISIKDTPNSEDICASQDFIESSQDSAVTTISVKSSKPLEIKKAVVVLEPIQHAEGSAETDTQNLIDDQISIDLTNMENNSDIELPCNKTNLINLTEEMDTQPIDYNAVDVFSENKDPPILVISEVVIEPYTQNTADADTEPVDPNMFLETYTVKTGTFDSDQNTQITDIPESNKINSESAEIIVIEDNETNASLMTTAEDVTKTLSESILIEVEKEDSNTACNNEQRKKDFLNNTLQISPIKSMSPVRDEKSPSPETSTDYVVINLTSPVQSNGQPFEICESPEIFTEDKVSPDKRDQSPPREEVSVKSGSPSSSLSLKKNRPQMRSGGRAAQMLGLCVPDRLQPIMASEKHTDPEEAKRSPSLNTSAKRNLRILYNSSVSNSENINTSDDTEDSESFLKFKRTLPTTDCSPSGPILKRKLIDITDETTASPASKRKRVSFHDPPVSTTICVKKYIEPISIRSPQNSATKRLERQTRAQTAAKSPRRLENAFKLDCVLTKAVESFTGAPETMTEDTEMSSLDETPVLEIIKTSDLNDTDPICKELEDCEDLIDNIAAELSSPAMKALLVKKFEGKVETIGDLAKMTELEVNRLCIKAPKVQIAKKVLNEYLSKLKQASEEITPTVEAAMSESTVLEARKSIEVQTDSTTLESTETQTDSVSVALASSQTDEAVMSHSFAQTNETGSKSTTDIITECLSERPDFVERLSETMDEISKKKILENLPNDVLIKILLDKSSSGDGKHVLSILQDHLVERFEHKDLILFCSSLLKMVYDA